jgi:hypothetical protein
MGPFDPSCHRSVFVFAFAGMLTAVLAAQEGDQSYYLLPEDVVSCGGGIGTSSHCRIQDVIGEPFAPGPAFTVEFGETTGFIEVLTASLDNPLDINVDGAVGPEDTFTFATGWLRTEGQSGYRERADIDGNLVINRYDLDRYLVLRRENP